LLHTDSIGGRRLLGPLLGTTQPPIKATAGSCPALAFPLFAAFEFLIDLPFPQLDERRLQHREPLNFLPKAVELVSPNGLLSSNHPGAM
jgi:hypothetical protein